MYKYKSNTFELMGVINITPDSFSDAGKFNNINSINLFLETQGNRFNILDFGAESTAPFNSKVTLEEENRRIKDIFLPLLKSNLLGDKIISIDTYKPEIIKMLLPHLKDHQVIWNDVSGVVDDETINIVLNNNIQYVLSHTNLNDKSDTSNHMKYIDDSDNWYENMIERLNSQLSQLPKDRVIIDACFGFSKTREQNLQLLENYNDFHNVFPKFTHMVGISKKSFLRPPGAKLSDDGIQELVREKQSYYIEKILNSSHDGQFIFRLHDSHDIDNILSAI